MFNSYLILMTLHALSQNSSNRQKWGVEKCKINHDLTKRTGILSVKHQSGDQYLVSQVLLDKPDLFTHPSKIRCDSQITFRLQLNIKPNKSNATAEFGNIWRHLFRLTARSLSFFSHKGKCERVTIINGILLVTCWSN